MGSGIRLADWILGSVGERITHLKLQKLAFYCYGATLAAGCEQDVGEIDFEAWAHGPVCREIWNEYRAYGAAVLPVPAGVPTYAEPARRQLADALAVYGRLGAWNLRQQTHLEEPWRTAWTRKSQIDRPTLKAFFAKKFNGQVAWPEYLSRASSLALDGIPQETFPSLHALAAAARAS